MRCRTLINLLSKYNDHNIIAALKYKPNTIVFIRYKSQQNKNIFMEVKKVIQKQLPGTEIIDRVISAGNPQKLEDIIKDYADKDTIINLSGGSKISSIIAYKVAIEKNILSIVVDLKGKGFYKIRGKSIELQREPFTELKVDEIISTSGAAIVEHSTGYYQSDECVELLNYVMNNFEQWKIVKDILRDKDIVSIDKDEPLRVSLDLSHINKSNSSEFKDFMNNMNNREFISKCIFFSERADFSFRDVGIKRFILTSGIWLEALTYRLVDNIEEVDDIKSGVLFEWDRDLKHVRNEVDVVAAVDSTLMCISCKDTEKYDVEELNELQVYSEKLGGEDVKKILVASREPLRQELVMERAEEMNINVIIFNGDVKLFQSRLRDIVLK